MVGLELKYFVLKPRSKRWDDNHAQASRKAMRAYASHIRDEDRALSDALFEWAQMESSRELELKPVEGE